VRLALAGAPTHKFFELLEGMMTVRGPDPRFNVSFVYTLSVIKDGILFGNDRVGPIVGNSDRALESVSQALWAYLSALKVSLLF